MLYCKMFKFLVQSSGHLCSVTFIIQIVCFFALFYQNSDKAYAIYSFGHIGQLFPCNLRHFMAMVSGVPSSSSLCASFMIITNCKTYVIYTCSWKGEQRPLGNILLSFSMFNSSIILSSSELFLSDFSRHILHLFSSFFFFSITFGSCSYLYVKLQDNNVLIHKT